MGRHRSGRALDPTGAGDVFATAFLVRYQETGNPSEAAVFACCAASCVVEGVATTTLGDRAEIMFKMLDANGDGKVTLEEFRKRVAELPSSKLKDRPEAIARIFERMDENGDGYVTLAEFKKFRAQMAARLKDSKPGEKKKDGK